MTPRSPQPIRTAQADHGISLRARGTGKNIGDSDGTPLDCGKPAREPLLAVPGKLHMSQLHLPAGEVLLDVQVQANQREVQRKSALNFHRRAEPRMHPQCSGE